MTGILPTMYNTSGSDIDIDEMEMHSGSRKIAKTYVEKKRRDRINRSLDELKDLLAVHCDKARYQKLEKAEILEMCVEFVKQRTESMKTLKQNYDIGYQQCMSDVGKFLQTTPDIPNMERQRLLNHLSSGNNNRRYQPYRTSTNSHHTIVNEWFHRCGASNGPSQSQHQPLIDSSSSERSNTSSPSSIDDHSERSVSSSSLWRPW